MRCLKGYVLACTGPCRARAGALVALRAVSVLELYLRAARAAGLRVRLATHAGHVQALRILSETSSGDTLDTADIMMGIGSLLYLQSERGGSVELARRALERYDHALRIQTQLLGAHNPVVAETEKNVRIIVSSIRPQHVADLDQGAWS
jgi:hypothetical protein